MNERLSVLPDHLELRRADIDCYEDVEKLNDLDLAVQDSTDRRIFERFNSRDDFYQMISRADVYGANLVIEDKKRNIFVGSVTGTRRQWGEGRQITTTDSLGTREEYRGQGLASRLMDAHERLASLNIPGMENCGVDLLVSPLGAEAFYKSRGFEPYFEMDVSYDGEPINEMNKRRWLRKTAEKLPIGSRSGLKHLFVDESRYADFVFCNPPDLPADKLERVSQCMPYNREPYWTPRGRFPPPSRRISPLDYCATANSCLTAGYYNAEWANLQQLSGAERLRVSTRMAVEAGLRRAALFMSVPPVDKRCNTCPTFPVDI